MVYADGLGYYHAIKIWAYPFKSIVLDFQAFKPCPLVLMQLQLWQAGICL